MVDKLIDIISREANLFEDFLGLLERQQKALVENNVAELNAVTELQREKVTQSKRFNDERERLLAEIKQANAIEGDLTVTRLLQMVDDNRATQLTELRQSILDLNDRILKTRNQNAMLLNRSREYIRKTMEMLSRVSRPADDTYSSAGAGGGSTETRNVALDRRA